jgi:sugar-phosphatase
MKIDTVIFDMDGLLIDSEPLWYEAAKELLKKFNTSINEDDYNQTTGLRTPEFLHHWFSVFGIDHRHIKEAEVDIIERVINKVQEKGQMMKGVESALKIITEKGFKIGLASSSPFNVIEAVLAKMNLAGHFMALSSAEHLPYGKPNPQVFLDCADALNSHPTSCICIEDSFNGLIAAKAARMKCIIVPHPSQFEMERWNIADLKLTSLDALNTSSLDILLK